MINSNFPFNAVCFSLSELLMSSLKAKAKEVFKARLDGSFEQPGQVEGVGTR